MTDVREGDEASDATIEAIVRALRPLPTVDEAAKARVLIAVAAERERERETLVGRGHWRSSRSAFVRVAGLVAAGAVAVLLLQWPGERGAEPGTLADSPPVAGPSTTTLAGSDVASLDAVRQPVELVFRAPSASRVRVVGEFNSWDPNQSPMSRDPESGLWSVTLSLRPGRHVYAFVVDDSLWVRDPRAPAAPDADFGRPGSVLLVGRPR